MKPSTIRSTTLEYHGQRDIAIAFGPLIDTMTDANSRLNAQITANFHESRILANFATRRCDAAVRGDTTGSIIPTNTTHL